MENMLGISTLQEIGRLLNQVWERLIGPDREFWIGALKRFLRQEEPVFLKTERAIPFRKEKQALQKFYKAVFGIDVDFSDVFIPMRPGSARDWLLVIVARGMTPQRLFDKCREKFGAWKWTDRNLDEIVISDRTAKDGHYAIWVRNRIEADEEFKNLSADDLKKQNHKGITLEERLILELFHFWKAKKHLDIQNITLCAGSCDSDGDVPRVYWRDGRLDVRWCSPGGALGRLRSREVVS